MFKLGANSIGFEVTHRKFGKQDRGITPKGANDQVSFITAWALLGEPKNFLCFEIFFVKKIIFNEASIFTLTGAHYEVIFLNGKKIDHATVYKARPGDVLELKQCIKGFRLYLMASQPDPNRIGVRSKGYSYYFPEHRDRIRVTPGPEYDYLKEGFLNYRYQISHTSDLSGLRLEQKLKAHRYDIITSAVTDGTIQLTKDGPIILMRHRQTTGGYPRILQVIEADIDRLAQYPHGSFVTFELITLDRSKQLLLDHEQKLQQMHKDLGF
jgi:allophanate hydrolase subunit 2